MLWWLELGPATEIDSDQSGDVRNCKLRATDKFALLEARTEPGKEMLNARAAAFSQRRDLIIVLRSR